MKASQRLVDSISGAVSGATSDGAQSRALATAYAEACERAEQRLARCEEMLSRGEALQAVQYAEADPPLLDEVATLEFFGVDGWRRSCREAGLPVGEIRNQRAVRLLNEAYASGVPASSHLYRDYRAAVAARDDERALEILGLINRLNPGDANAATEADRLRRKLRDAHLRTLPGLLKRTDEVAVLRCVESIERLDIREDIEGEGWREATQVVARLRADAARKRCGRVPEMMAEARGKGDYGRVLALADAAREDCVEHGISLDRDLSGRIAEHEAWASALEAKARCRIAMERFAEDFRGAVAEVEDCLLGTHGGDGDRLGECRDRLEKLWLDGERLGAKLDGATIARFQRCQRRVKAAIRRIHSRKCLVAAAPCVAASIIIVAVALPLWSRARTRSDVSELQRLRSARRCESAAALVGRLEARNAKLTPTLRSAIDGARAWIEGERAAAAAVGILADAVEKDLDAGLRAEALPDALRRKSELEEKARALCEELRPGVVARIAPLSDRLESERAKVVRELGQRLRPAIEELLGRGDDSLGLSARMDKMRQAARDFEGIRAEVALWRTLATERESTDLTDRVLARVAPLREELLRFDTGLSDMRAATDLEAYLGALRPVAFTKLTAAPEALGAREVVGMSHAFTDLNRHLFAPGLSREEWELVRRGAGSSFVPEKLAQEEKDLLFALRDEENFYSIHRVFGRVQSKGTPLMNVPISEFCVKGDARAGRVLAFRRSGSAAGKAKMVIFESAELVPASEPTLFPECEFFLRSGIRTIVAPEGERGRGGISLLAIMDAIKDGDRFDPVFRAAVHLRLAALARVRPLEWGWAWAPTAQEHARALESVATSTELGIRSTDWLLPGENPRRRELEGRLGALYAAMPRVSYELQARALRRIASEGVTRGTVFSGFTGPDGQPVLHPRAPAALLLWGWPRSGDRPVVVFARGGAGEPWRAVADSPIFGPLFAPPVPPAQILGEIRDALRIPADSPELSGQLPPFFLEVP